MTTDIELRKLEACRFSKCFKVLPADTVSFVSSSFPVLSTPAIIGQVERACRAFLLDSCGGESVGAAIEVDHSAPALLNSTISIEAQINRVEFRRVEFSFQVSDEIEVLANGKHTRVMIDLVRSGARLTKKAERLVGLRSSVENELL